MTVTLEEEYTRLLEDVAVASQIIFTVTATSINRNGEMCPHDIAPTFPTHAWWCDDCWNKLQDALVAAETFKLEMEDDFQCKMCGDTGVGPPTLAEPGGSVCICSSDYVLPF